MAYDVHITRRAKWFHSEGMEITRAEWRSIIEHDPEMRLSEGAEPGQSGRDAARDEGPDLAEWTGHPHEDFVWFNYRRGNIVVADPDETTLMKMQEIARTLTANVQGDDGESYT